MQIEAFVLYHRDGERQRTLGLHEGLNVITGWRNTGKSSLLDIVEYCFGRSRLTVSQGKVRRTVGWYGLVLRNGDDYAFAGRPAPREGTASTSDAMWLPLAGAEPPRPQDLAANTNASDLREQLSSFCSFADVRFEPPPGAVRPPLRLHVAHVLPMCMQDEEDIASRSRLVHRGQDREVTQALRDAIPYWVGAADEEAPALRSRLTVVNRELNQAQRALDRIVETARTSDERSLALLSQAEAVGLVSDPTAARGSVGAVQEALQAAQSVDPEEAPEAVPKGEVEALLAQRRVLQARLAQAERNEDLVRSFQTDQEAYAAETSEQHARLATIGLLEPSEGQATCPVCESALSNADPSQELLASNLRRLEEELRSVADIAPRSREALDAAMKATREVREELRVINEALRDLAARDRQAAGTRTLGARRAYVQGLIAEYTRTLSPDDRSSENDLRAQIEQLQAERRALENQLDTGGEAERLSGAMNLVGADMTNIARELELEHSEDGQIRFELGHMTLVADTLRDGSFPLSGIGGAGTRVGYHLAVYLAFHRLLRGRNRPGPAFVMLDHPTGPFYPEDSPAGEEPQLRHEDDRAIVGSMFELLRDVADGLGGALQIIVTDHARLDAVWFEQAIAANWRDGRGLIPDDWEDATEHTES